MRRVGFACWGLDTRSFAGHHISPYRLAGKRSKKNATDAAAICDAASRQHMHSVPVKSAEQQGWLLVHRLREGHKEERNVLINHFRGLLTGVARLSLQRAHLQWISPVIEIAWCDKRIAEHVRQDPRTKAASQLIGVGPSQNSSGGKASHGRITKRNDRISQWLVQLPARVCWQKAVVALANKVARILWCAMTCGDKLDPHHVPVAPRINSRARKSGQLRMGT